jgi:molecular chaperone GrpE
VTDPAGQPADDVVDPAEVEDPAGEASTSGIDRPDVADLAVADLESLTTQTLDQLEAVTAERDDYLDRLRRLQADFENYKKRSAKEHREAGERAMARLADQLLPVLDSCDAAMMHGASGVEPVFAALLGVLEKEGLERIDPLDAAFDPELHEAVLHEHAEEPHDQPRVVEVLRPGYAWKGQIIRAAMVKVRG